jgi:tRNA (mo5U34)-methyltransferase
MDVEELRRRVEQIGWWHSIDLGGGVVTRGYSDNVGLLKRLQLPADLRGTSVLDIGAFDGFFSFEAERRGAARVLAVDSVEWGGAGWGVRKKAGFELARTALNSRVTDMELDVLEISPEKVGAFDLVLLLGVLYHVRHPLLLLERVRRVTRQQLILETHVDLLHCDRPAAAFYPGRELVDDPTNWWGPNPAAVEGMLRVAGYRKAQLVSLWGTPRSGLVDAVHALTRTPGVLRHPRSAFADWFGRRRRAARQQGRAVFHAWP